MKTETRCNRGTSKVLLIGISKRRMVLATTEIIIPAPAAKAVSADKTIAVIASLVETTPQVLAEALISLQVKAQAAVPARENHANRKKDISVVPR